MQKLLEVPDKKGGNACVEKEPSWQKEAHSLSAVTSGVTTPKAFLLLVEGTMRLSLDDTLANFSTRSRCFFLPMTKNTK